MDLSAFQLFKNNKRTNDNSRIYDTLIIQYARVIKVIDIQTVVAEAVIQTSLSREVYTVSLLNLSSALLEINAYPKLGDTVLLLFLQRHDPRMFIEKTVNNPNATGYNRFSGVGVLMSTVKNIAQTIISFYEDNGIPIAGINSEAEIHAVLNNTAVITFCRAVMDSEDEQLITMCFGQGRPFMQRFLSTVTREHGFWKNSEDELIELDASVTERYSKYAPISKDIQGSQVYKIGIGEDGDTEAPVDIELGEKADITISSKSGFEAHFEKAVTIKNDATELIEIGNTIATLGAMISEFIDLTTNLNDLVTNLDTVGSPASHTTGPVAKPQLQALKGELNAFKTKWEKVFS